MTPRASRRQIALGTMLGTIVLFVWGALSHVVVINGVGYAPLPNEAAFKTQLLDVEPGLYAFPAPPDWVGQARTDESNAAWIAAFERGPSGMLIVRPVGEGPFSPEKLLVQFLADLLAVLLAVWVIGRLSGSFFRRALSVACFGAVAVLTVGMISWNWYAFTTSFFVAQAFDMVVGWSLVGIALAASVPAPRAQ